MSLVIGIALSKQGDQDDLVKAGGFSRGPKAQHKYWKRVRVMSGGKARWKYYYNTPADKKRWMEDRAAAIQAKREKLSHGVDAEDKHAHKAEFQADHPELANDRVELQKLTHEYLTEMLAWEKPPQITVSEAVMNEFHNALIVDGEPDNPLGKAISPMRALELAFARLPAPIKEHFPGPLSSLTIGKSEEAGIPGAVGTCDRPGAAGGPSNITIDFEIAQMLAKNRGARMFGGLLPVEVIVHEMAHAIHNQLGANGNKKTGAPHPKGKVPQGGTGWPGPNYHDWLDFLDKEQGIAERGVTGYAEFNDKERWAESFAAALLYPQQLALTAPRTYEWFRSFFGDEHMRPIRTDKDKVRRLEAEREQAIADKDEAKALKLKTEIDRSVGVLDMDREDPRLQWWKKPQTKVQKLLQDEALRQQNLNNDHMDLSGRRFMDDKFYEMNVGGRTVYMRIGRESQNHKYSGWAPDHPGDAPIDRKAATGRYQLRKEEIKEIYDADGNPLTNDTARWYLQQDMLTDEPPAGHQGDWDPGDLEDFSAKISGTSNRKALDRMRFDKWLKDITWGLHGKKQLEAQLADAKGGGPAAEKLEAKISALEEKYGMLSPVELSEDDFRVRSGTFGYDRWSQAGEDIAARLRRPGLSPEERKQLEAEYRVKQPGVVRTSKGQIERVVANAGEAPVPRLHTIRYVNDNPDGTQTVIETQQGPDGHYYIKSPVWRQLLTPHGDNVRSAEHLRQLCVQAARDRRRTWVSIKTDTRGGDTGHFYHVEVQFDGRGQPRILGDEWQRRLGKEQPRLDDLLTPGSVSGSEKGRPQLKAEKIKLRKPRKRGPRYPTRVGDSAIIEVERAELGYAEIPPPGWDRVPPMPKRPDGTIPERPPLPRDMRLTKRKDPKTGAQITVEVEAGKSQKLTVRERRLIKQGLLPDWFRGTIKQREWVRRHFQPEFERWERTRKKAVPVVLKSIVPEKKKGELPPPPGWDRMPEGTPSLPEPPVPTEGKKPKASKLTARERKFIKQGLLPDSYKGHPEQREWLQNHFMPAYEEWDRTKEQLKDEYFPPRYVFITAPGSGRPGRTVSRFSKASVQRSTKQPFESHPPKALEHDTLVYQHKVLNPIDGSVIRTETRIMLPRDGTVTTDHVRRLAGVRLQWELPDGSGRTVNRPVPGVTPDILVDMDGFHQIRMHLGGLSMTSEAEARLRQEADTLREAARRQQMKKHVVEIEDLDPGKMARGEVDGFGNVGLHANMPNGRPFTLAQHQKELVQLVVDNGGRALGAHYMGTGKTVSAIVMAKLMMAMKDPTDPEKRHPNAPKKTLIVAPLNTVEQWRQASFDFDDGCTVIGNGAAYVPVDEYLDNAAKGLDTNDLVIVGPEYWTIHQEKLRKAGFDGLIVDEAHMGIKDETTSRNQAIKEWNPDMKLLSLLTGTPITVSPSDILQYIQVLSKGEQWGGYSQSQWEREFLEESPIPGLTGAQKKVRVQIKPSKRAEVAAVVAQWTHVAMPKDVRGKTLPAVRIEENRHAHMTGTQALLYGLAMAALSDADRNKLASGTGTLAEDELAGLEEGVKKKVQIAKAIANCAGYKPASLDKFIMTYREVPTRGGKLKKEAIPFKVFRPSDLMARKDIADKRVRKKLMGKWPRVGEGFVNEHQAALYSALFQELFPGGYEAWQGRPITPEQLQWMKNNGWDAPGGKNIANPDFGPVGIRCRGSDKPRTDEEYRKSIGQAIEFQRAFKTMMEQVRPKNHDEMETVLAKVASNFGVGMTEGYKLLGMRPNDTEHQGFTEYGGVRVEEGETWYSDQRGSLHLLYHPDDWDHENDRPKGGRFGELAQLEDGGRVAVKKKFEPKPVIPKGTTKAERARIKAEFVPPELVYVAEAGEQGGKIAIRRMDTGDTMWVPKDSVSVMVKSLMDPGYRYDSEDGSRVSLRYERRKADIAMTIGSAKSEELRDHIRTFHQDGEPGPNGARQMVLFANGILDGCRPIEATLRTMGYKDVNEALPGSVEYDPDDPNPGNGKYFVTYIGSTYTGDRDLNAEIFKKVKDDLGRDLDQSLFVQKCLEGRPWRPWAAAPPHGNVTLSQWLPEQRKAIKDQFGIAVPESYFTDAEGIRRHFYGSNKSVKVLGETYAGSAAILREMVLVGDPTKIQDEVLADQARKKLLALQVAYEQLATEEHATSAEAAGAASSADPPLSRQQQTVFSNCEFIVCSDAAQVGLNFGNAVEMVNYDSLGSPMREWQRITRSARMLPPAVEDSLLGETVMVPKIDQATGEVAMKDGKPIMVPQLDRHGNPVLDGTGPVSKLQRLEQLGELFRPAQWGAPTGKVTNLSFGGKDFGDMEFGQALNAIATWAEGNLAAAPSAAAQGEWSRIMNRAVAASNLGTTAAVAFFEEMKETQLPGSTESVLGFTDTPHEDPMEGTYDYQSTVAVDEPARAIQQAIDGGALTETERQQLVEAGFAKNGGQSVDAAGLYMAMRARDILTRITDMRDQMAARMRSAAGGAVIQDSDVMNAIIDSLSPSDRAVLKYQKYLVNVRRVGVSGHVPTMQKSVDPETGETVAFFTGYERQHPITPEQNVRATGRARMVAVENLLKHIQEKTPIRVEMDYETTTATEIGNMSLVPGANEKRIGVPVGKPSAPRGAAPKPGLQIHEGMVDGPGGRDPIGTQYFNMGHGLTENALISRLKEAAEAGGPMQLMSVGSANDRTIQKYAAALREHGAGVPIYLGPPPRMRQPRPGVNMEQDLEVRTKRYERHKAILLEAASA